MIDTHAHIDGPEFLDDFNDMIHRAKDAGVSKILIPNVNDQTLPRILQLCKEHPGFLYPMIGLHPEDVDPTKRNVDELLKEMEKILELDRATTRIIVAIGEVGLDFYWDATYKDLQMQVFERQVKWAAEYNLPLMIHARNAHEELISIMTKYQQLGVKGVFHCFTGNEQQARQLLQFDGFMLGIGGVATFKKSSLPFTLQNAVPLNRIVLETDAPYMAPVPNRGKRNEPAFVVETAKKIAEIYQCSLQEIDELTTRNVNQIFYLF